MIKKLVALAATALLLAACVQAPPRVTEEERFGTPPPDAPFAGSVWALLDIRGEEQHDSGVSVEFTTDGAFSGFGGCNPFGGSYVLDDSTLTIGDDIVTGAAACTDEAQTALESELLGTLKQTQTFEVGDGRLTLTASDGGTMRFIAIPQTLGGTTWTVTGLLRDDALSSVVEGTELTLDFAEDGNLTGSAGCSKFSGEFTDVDGVLTVSEVTQDTPACTDPEGIMEQEAAFLDALAAPAFIHRDARGLTLREAQEGEALMTLATRD